MKACRGIVRYLPFVAVAAMVGSVAWAALPGAANRGLRARLDSPSVAEQFAERGFTGKAQSSGPANCESTGFEAVEATCGWEAGWSVCGSTFEKCSEAVGRPPYSGVCSAPTGLVPEPDNCCSVKPNPATKWYMSGSSQHCDEPHIDTVHPSSGLQHMRFQRSPAVAGTGHGTATRVNAFTVRNNPFAPSPYASGISDVSWDISADTAAGLPQSSFVWFTVADAQASGVAVQVLSDTFGYVQGYDYVALAYFNLGYMDAAYPGANANGYHTFHMVLDVCHNVANYYWDGALKHTTTPRPAASSGLERSIFQHDNVPAGTIDWDNYSVNRTVPCPPAVCGDGTIEQQEECEPTDDACCPGRCVNCLCTRPNPICDDAQSDPLEVFNGANGPFLTHGGFFSYTADASFTSIDTCGSNYDTEIFWNLSADCGQFELFNDECSDDPLLPPGYQDPANPHADCYQPTGFPGDSCLCAATVGGQEYTFLVDQYAAGGPTFTTPACSLTVVNIEKKIDCQAGPIPGGACCDTLTGDCTDGVEAIDCDGTYEVYSDNKTCLLVDCDPRLGACCNTAPGSGGACLDTTQANCMTGQYVTWNPDDLCADVDCDEVTGSCCNTISGVCTPNVTDGACTGVWVEGGACPGNCVAATGACCVGDGTAGAACTDGSTLAQCDAAGGVWTQSGTCATLPDPCESDFTAIPTVSEWGLAVLALLLLIGGKIYFSRRDAAMA